MIYEIPYKGKNHPIALTYSTILEFQQKTNKHFEALDTDLELYKDLLFIALKKGYRSSGKDNPFTIEDMADILDESYYELQGIILYQFMPDVEKKMKNKIKKTK